MYADAVVCCILQADTIESPSHNLALPAAKMDKMHFKECLVEMLQEMFGEDSVPKMFKGDQLFVTVDGKKADIDLIQLVSFKRNISFY